MEGQRKFGRPRKPYITSWGEHIDRLRRRVSDGRWKNVETRETWVEPDERRAVARFREWQARQESAVVKMPAGSFKSLSEFEQAINQPNAELTLTLLAQGSPTGAVDFRTPTAALWAWFREQLIARPHWVAEMAGIPEAARLADLPKCGPSPTLESIGELNFAKAGITDHEREKNRLFWKEFGQAVLVNTVRELTSEILAAYYDAVLAAGMSATYVKHRFGKVKTILNFAKKRGLDANDLRHALDCCAVLVTPNSTTLNPHPISREDFHRLLKAADAEMKAMLLLALNCCMYGHEVVSLEWADVNFANRVLITDRSKTGVTRIAVLWERTIKALEVLPRKREHIFVGARGAPANALLAELIRRETGR